SLIANYKNGNREIISNGYNGFIIKHNDIKGFKYKILDIISNHNRYLKIYENSYSTYLSKLSFPVWKEKMDVVILDKFDCNHVKRKESISKPSYIKNILIYKGLCQYDSIHRFIFEYLKSGLSIFFLYINRNK
ncbi:MAG TPA: glycosyltransferase family 4 protein, partial [Gallicola sp.]|nr:glycosyltransferase family 4 protein [Gallicola sp.]